MHVVHYKNIYDSVSDAAGEPDGIATLAYFFEVRFFYYMFDVICRTISPGQYHF